MAESSLDSLRQKRDISVTYRAYELRPEKAEALPPEVEEHYRKRVEAGWPRLRQIAKERFGLELNQQEHPRSHPSRLAHIGAKHAIAQGHGDAYHHAVFRAHWQEARDISSADTLVEIAEAIGLDGPAFRAALANPDYQAEVEADEYWAWQQQLSGVPAFIFGDRYLVSGAQPVEVLEEVVDKCLEEGLGA
jgi:predicted DsbA family dithiol-disulfide isomerase